MVLNPNQMKKKTIFTRITLCVVLNSPPGSYIVDSPVKNGITKFYSISKIMDKYFQEIVVMYLDMKKQRTLNCFGVETAFNKFIFYTAKLYHSQPGCLSFREGYFK